MKTKLITIVLSFFVATCTAHATIPNQPPAKKQPPMVIHKIDLNEADATTLTGSVKGIGKKRAEAIVAYRKSHHGFKSIEELAEVKGLGQHFVTANRDKLNQVFVVNKIQ